MNNSLKVASLLATLLAIAGCSVSSSVSTPTVRGATNEGLSVLTAPQIPEWQAKNLAHPACASVVAEPTCLALIVNGVASTCLPSNGGCGLTAANLETAYNLTSELTNGSGQVVAVVEAGDDASATTELATYRTVFRLGKAKFRKYNQEGQRHHYPPSCANYEWCGETALDIEMISAACPKCTIYLMETDSTSTSDLEAAEAEVVKLGAHIVSNSWSCENSSDCGDPNFSNYFNSPGVAYLASSGDHGYGKIGAPAVLDSVIAVGGTQLKESSSTFSETVWSGAGAGCASGVTKPSWQHDPDCAYRTVADVSAEAGCEPGVAVYGGRYGTAEWREVCGTSVSSPFIAGVIGLAGNATSQNGGGSFWSLSKKQHTHDFRVIKSGSDGSCNDEYLCMAGAVGKNKYFTYSGPAGWGTPNSTSGY